MRAEPWCFARISFLFHRWRGERPKFEEVSLLLKLSEFLCCEVGTDSSSTIREIPRNITKKIFGFVRVVSPDRSFLVTDSQSRTLAAFCVSSKLYDRLTTFSQNSSRGEAQKLNEKMSEVWN